MKRKLGCVGVFTAMMLVAGCSDSSLAGKSLLGSYDVMISNMSVKPNVSDPDVLTLFAGHDSTLLLYFQVGITTDAMGPNPNGLVARLDGSTLTLAEQPAHVDHSTGQLDGMMAGEGTLTPDGTSLDLTLHFAASGGAGTLDYNVTGAKQ